MHKPFFAALLFLNACSHSPAPERVVQSDPNGSDETETVEAPKPLAAGMKALFAKGYDRYRHSDFAGAIQQWEPIWMTQKKAADNWTPSLLYYCYLATGQYKKALALGEENLKATPTNPLGYQQVGLAALWLGDNAKAEDFLRKVIEFESHSPDVFFYLGLALQRRGKKAEAEAEFNRGEKEALDILKTNPSDFPANYGLAYSYLFREKQAEEVPRILAAARKSLKDNPDVDLTPDKNLYAKFYLPLLEGMSLSRLKKSREALDALLISLQNSPSGARADLAEVYHFIGRNLKVLGEPHTAKEFLAKAIELDPHGPYAKVKVP